jgi:hypothetical protein
MLLLLAVAPAGAQPFNDPVTFIEDHPLPESPDDGSERFLTFGLMAMPGWFGLRAQLDVWSVEGFSIGGAGTLFARGDDIFGEQTFKAFGVGYLAYTAQLHRAIKLRLQVGYGGAYAIGWNADTLMVESTTSRLVEAAALLTIRAGHDWSIVAGPVIERTTADMIGSETTLMMFVGWQRRF